MQQLEDLKRSQSLKKINQLYDILNELRLDQGDNIKKVDGVSPYEKAQNERVAELHAKFRRQFPDFEMETQALSYSKKQLTMVLNVSL